jgi:hypothetical protein
MGTRLRNRNGRAASAWLALAGMIIGVAVLALPAAGAAMASAAGPTDPVYRELGVSVAMSGATAVVGAPGVIGNGHFGAIYIFARSGKVWRHQATLYGSAKHGIGLPVAVSSTASGTFVLTAAGGQALVYQRSGTAWHLQAKLLPLPAKPPYIPYFGTAVAISGTTAVVSTAQSQLNGRGGIYVFDRSGTTWHRQAILYDPDPDGEGNFGGSLAVSGSTILAGASSHDCAFVFTRSGHKWSLQAALNPLGQVAACTEPVNGAGFGQSVAISGSTAVIGAPGTDHGAAYVFTRSGTTWSQQATLTGSHDASNDFFGFSVALSRTRALVGATYGVFSTPPPPSHCGTAYEYTRSGHTWRERTEVANPGCSDGDLFGWSVAISGTSAMIGAPGAHDDAGAVYQENLR